MLCPSCATDVASLEPACPRCGAPADFSPTRTHSAPAPAPADVRFAPGTLLAGRYRIVALLGKGGMGEVYRADDLKLGKAVALKFLPASLADDPARLARFHNEVRVAQEVTNANVCRVHDIGEAGGAPFLSMEYVDGEDLSSLLRRIGRLPRDKGVEIARQLCAGLAAAHERGVLHRDLKPANVMLDGRGRVRITDFGLAGLADQTSREDVASGTPAYMAPEQAAGRQVTVKSDLYALGLVLYEVFTGKPAFSGATRAELLRAHRDSTPTSPRDHVTELDPAIERAILRCLEKDPKDRPASALAVAAALPGGDPLAAALAAGETPSPEMVAAAGQVGALASAVALRWLAAAALLAAAYYGVYFGARLYLVQRVPMELSPETLASRARELLGKLNVAGGGPYRVFGLRYERGILAYIAQREATVARIDSLSNGRPAVVHLWYRESPSPFFSRTDLGYVTEEEPALSTAGMVKLELDTKGRLLSLRAVPPRHLEALEAPKAPDWGRLFEAAGLELERFERAAPEWVPPAFADERAAWVGGYGAQPEIEVRVEAAAFRGRPVYFEILGPWSVGAPARLPSLAFRNAVAALLPLTVAFLAWRNYRLGRGDRRGAFRLASFVFTLMLLQWLFVADHASDVFLEWSLFTRGVAWALFAGGFFWAFYVAVEPYVRRLWPESIVAWSRLLAGRYRDPLVGRDVLIGLTLGFASLLFFALAVTAHTALAGGPPRLFSAVDLDALLGPRFLLAGLVGSLRVTLQVAFLVLSLILILRILLRRPWLVASAFVLIFTAMMAARLGTWSGRLHALDYPLLAAMTALNYLLLTRVGLLAYLAYGLPAMLALNFPAIAPDLSAWHASSFVVPSLVLAALAAWAFRTATGGRPVFSDGVFPS